MPRLAHAWIQHNAPHRVRLYEGGTRACGFCASSLTSPPSDLTKNSNSLYSGLDAAIAAGYHSARCIHQSPKGSPQESPGLLRVIQPRVPKHQHGRRALWSPPRTRKVVRLTSVLRYASLYLPSKCGLLLHRQLCNRRCRCAETVAGGWPTERVGAGSKDFRGCGLRRPLSSVDCRPACRD